MHAHWTLIRLLSVQAQIEGSSQQTGGQFNSHLLPWKQGLLSLSNSLTVLHFASLKGSCAVKAKVLNAALCAYLLWNPAKRFELPPSNYTDPMSFICGLN